MIKVRVSDIEKIKIWYVDSVLPIVMKRSVDHIPGDEFEKTIIDSLNDRMFCTDVLGLSIQEVVARYEWVRQYKETVDFLVQVKDLYRDIKQIKGKGRQKKIHQLLKKSIEQNRNDIIDDKLEFFTTSKNEEGWPNEVTITKGRFVEFEKSLKKRIEILNNLIRQRFDYSAVLANSDIRGQLVARLNIKVCPYCNRQYINPITIDRHYTYLGDIDHVLPKSKYALFQLSFNNMIPVCKVCNQLFKMDKAADIMNPYQEGFDDDVFFEIRYSTVRELIGLDEAKECLWRVIDGKYNNGEDATKNLEKKRRIKNSIQIFRLDEVYKSNAIEFKRILRKKYINESRAYRERISDILSAGKNKRLEIMDEELLYGVSFDKEKFQDELLSKAVFDIVVKN